VVFVQMIYVVLTLVGLVLILIGQRYKVPEYKPFFGRRPWLKNGINPFSPIDSWRRKDWWTSKGFNIHFTGVVIFGIGILLNVSRVIYIWIQ